MATVSRQRKGPRSRRTHRGEPAVEQAHPIWVDVSGRRMFVVGFTSGGAPYGIFEDEMDVDADERALDHHRGCPGRSVTRTHVDNHAPTRRSVRRSVRPSG
jgi:hypothetical protein